MSVNLAGPRKDQHHHDPAVQFLTGVRGDRLAAIDVLFFLQAFRGDLKGPGQDQGGYQADR